jgi:hypothetical protein
MAAEMQRHLRKLRLNDRCCNVLPGHRWMFLFRDCDRFELTWHRSIRVVTVPEHYANALCANSDFRSSSLRISCFEAVSSNIFSSEVSESILKCHDV